MTPAPSYDHIPDVVEDTVSFLYGNRKVVAWVTTIVVGTVLSLCGLMDQVLSDYLTVAHALFVGGNAVEHLVKLKPRK